MSGARLALAVFVVLQLADGLITYAAVQTFGPAAEGNPLLRTWMHLLGAGTALVGAKLIACGGGALLFVCGFRRVLIALTMLYAMAAIGPWLGVLGSY